MSKWTILPLVAALASVTFPDPAFARGGGGHGGGGHGGGGHAGWGGHVGARVFGRYGAPVYAGVGHGFAHPYPYWGSGYWGWGGSGWIWLPGAWWTSPMYPGWVWIPAQWAWDGEEWVWQEGHWVPAGETE